MPWGWECRAKLIKQRPTKPTERKGKVSGEAPMPGPQHYQPPQIFCGKGFSKIKRAPAYTFGQVTPSSFQKPATTQNARMFNVQGYRRDGGQYRVTHGVVTAHLEPPSDKTRVPGPGAHAPRTIQIRYKRPPAYTLRPAARPTYQPWDQWTPPPNMYCPPIPGKNYPAYSLGNMPRELKMQDFPGPGEHDPNFNFVKKSKPAFSFGAPFRSLKPPKVPAPNTYCEKKFMVQKPTVPAPSFGIRHTQYLGNQDVYLKPSKLDIFSSNGS
ncbi:hypothetical protein evm_007223 [Chilo suppressalis]|nr:hypothetical protein evm_007223 [Chilo suppressalis]